MALLPSFIGCPFILPDFLLLVPVLHVAAIDTYDVFLWLQKSAEAQEYHKLIVSRLKEQRERRSESLAKKRAIRMASQASQQETTTGKQPAS